MKWKIFISNFACTRGDLKINKVQGFCFGEFHFVVFQRAHLVLVREKIEEGTVSELRTGVERFLNVPLIDIFQTMWLFRLLLTEVQCNITRGDRTRWFAYCLRQLSL